MTRHSSHSLPCAHVVLPVFHILQLILSPVNLAFKTGHCQLSEDAELEGTNEESPMGKYRRESPINKHVCHCFPSYVLVAANLHLRVNSSTTFSFPFFVLYTTIVSIRVKRNSKVQKKEPKNGENCTGHLLYILLSIYTSAAVEVTGVGNGDPCSLSCCANRCSLANMPTMGAVLYVHASVCM
jgi:hypothetical protein